MGLGFILKLARIRTVKSRTVPEIVGGDIGDNLDKIPVPSRQSVYVYGGRIGQTFNI